MQKYFIKFSFSLHHVEELVEIHEINFWFTQFRVRMTKLWLLEDRKMGLARF
jgi:hypothetical protein